MTRNKLNNAYFAWMCHLVCSGKRYSKKPSYMKLLHHLHDVDFSYILPMDGNRASDGENLRYRFGLEHNYHDAEIAAYLDDRPCSVLEMMIALANRCEESIMVDPEVGDRKGQWFWNMVVSLGLGAMHDTNYDPEYVDFVVDRFLDREYEPNGEGGLFTVKHTNRDLRTVEIWCQMCWYLDEN